MRRVSIGDLKPDMVIARSVYDGNARMLAQTGLVLTIDAITRLRRLGIGSVYICDQYNLKNITPPDIISETLRLRTITMVKTNFEAVQDHFKLNIQEVKGTVEGIIAELLANDNVLVHLTDIRTFDDYLFAHSVNVCVLSLLVGISLNYNRTKLTELAVGALLHDIGKIRIDPNILDKPDDLNQEEFAVVKYHTTYGFEILRNHPDIPLLSAHIAFQHHERWDGQGYPRGLAKQSIHEYARVVAVADAYDALLADRPYRPAYTIKQGLAVIKRMSGIYLDPNLVTALIANIAVYPVGSLVKTNTGYIGLVKAVNKAFPTRPLISIIMDNHGKQLKQYHEVDLSQLTTILIVRALSNKEIADLNLDSLAKP